MQAYVNYVIMLRLLCWFCLILAFRLARIFTPPNIEKDISVYIVLKGNIRRWRLMRKLYEQFRNTQT